MRLEAWKEASNSKRLQVNVKKTKMMISNENAGKVTIEGKFSYSVCRKDVGSNSILCQFCKCLVHKRCKGISKFRC